MLYIYIKNQQKSHFAKPIKVITEWKTRTDFPTEPQTSFKRKKQRIYIVLHYKSLQI